MRTGVIAIASLLLVGCSSDGGASGDDGGGDDGGGGCPDFATITAGDVHVDSSVLTFDMHLAGSPANLTYDQDGIPPDVLEYRWAVDIDTEADGTYDWQIAVSYFHQDATASHAGASASDEGQVDLWQLDGASASRVGSAVAQDESMGIALGIMTNAAPGITDIKYDVSTFRFNTHYQSGAGTAYCEDELVKTF